MMTKPRAAHDRQFRAAFHLKNRDDQIIEYSQNGHSYKVIARMNTARPTWRDDALLLAAAPRMRAILEKLLLAHEMTAGDRVEIRGVLNFVNGVF